MNVMRAKEILQSPEEIVVRYKDVPVWIQNVDEARDVARVYTRNEPDQEMDVPVDQLME